MGAVGVEQSTSTNEGFANPVRPRFFISAHLILSPFSAAPLNHPKSPFLPPPFPMPHHPPRPLSAQHPPSQQLHSTAAHPNEHPRNHPNPRTWDAPTLP
jgi:hypothetical protein